MQTATRSSGGFDGRTGNHETGSGHLHCIDGLLVLGLDFVWFSFLLHCLLEFLLLLLLHAPYPYIDTK